MIRKTSRKVAPIMHRIQRQPLLASCHKKKWKWRTKSPSNKPWTKTRLKCRHINNKCISNSSRCRRQLCMASECRWINYLLMLLFKTDSQYHSKLADSLSFTSLDYDRLDGVEVGKKRSDRMRTITAASASKTNKAWPSSQSCLPSAPFSNA